MNKQVEKIRAEVKRQMEEEMRFFQAACANGKDCVSGSAVAYTRLQMLLSFIDGMKDDMPEDFHFAVNRFISEATRGDLFSATDFADLVADWQRQQMAQQGEPAEIGYFNQRGLSIYLGRNLEDIGFIEGDKVRVVLIKEED